MYVDWVPRRRCATTVQNFRRHQFRETSSRTSSTKYVSKTYKRLELVIQSYLALRLNYMTHTLKWQLNCRKLDASRDWILRREPTSVARRIGKRLTRDNFSSTFFSCRYYAWWNADAWPSYDVTPHDILHAQCEECDNTSCLLIGHWGIFLMSSVSALWLGNFKY